MTTVQVQTLYNVSNSENNGWYINNIDFVNSAFKQLPFNDRIIEVHYTERNASDTNKHFTILFNDKSKLSYFFNTNTFAPQYIQTISQNVQVTYNIFNDNVRKNQYKDFINIMRESSEINKFITPRTIYNNMGRGNKRTFKKKRHIRKNIRKNIRKFTNKLRKNKKNKMSYSKKNKKHKRSKISKKR